MKLECPLPCSQKPATASCHEPDESSPHTTSLNSVFILSSHLHTPICIPGSLFRFSEIKYLTSWVTISFSRAVLYGLLQGGWIPEQELTLDSFVSNVFLSRLNFHPIVSHLIQINICTCCRAFKQTDIWLASFF